MGGFVYYDSYLFKVETSRNMNPFPQCLFLTTVPSNVYRNDDLVHNKPIFRIRRESLFLTGFHKVCHSL